MKNIIKNTTLAYAAGYIDGDGCFNIRKEPYKNKTSSKYPAVLIIASVNPEVQINENSQVLDWSTAFAKNPVTTTGLTWGYYGTPTDGITTGRWGGNITAAGTLSLTNNTENYISVAKATGVIGNEATAGSPSVAPTNWNDTANYSRAYKVWTSGGSVTLIEDYRAGRYGVMDVASAGATQSVAICVACSDETTELTSGTNKAKFRMPHAMTLTSVRASLSTAAFGSPQVTITVDINEELSTILSTKLTIDYGEKTSTTAAVAAVISDSSLADDAEIEIDIDVGGGGATGLKVYLIGTRAV